MEGRAAPTMPLFSFATHSGHRRSLYILGGGGRVCTFDLLLGGNSLHGALELEVAQLLIYEVGNRSPQGHFKTSDLTDICTSVFTAGFFTIAIKWKQFNCLAADPWINKIEYMHTMQQYRS